MAETGKRKCYDFRFKEAAVKHTEKNTNREAARKFSVDESMARRCRKVIDTSDLQQSPAKLSKRKRNFGGGKKPVLADLEEELLEIVIDDRDRHLHVPCKLITDWALDIAEKQNIMGFQVSRSRLFRFLKRGNLSVRRRTTTGQTMPKDKRCSVKNSKLCKVL